MEDTLNGKISQEELIKAIRNCNDKVDFCPFFVDQHQKQGVQLMLDAVIDYLPSPLEIWGYRSVLVEHETVLRHADYSDLFSKLLAFKFMKQIHSLTVLPFFRVTLVFYQRVHMFKTHQRETWTCRPYLQIMLTHVSENSWSVCWRYRCSCWLKNQQTVTLVWWKRSII